MVGNWPHRGCAGRVNIIPGRVLFTVDLRALTDALRLEATERFAAEAARIAKARGLTVSIETFHEIATAHCAPALQDALAASVTELGHTPIRLPSGAGHDAQVMARLCPRRCCSCAAAHQPQSGGIHSVADMVSHGSTHQIHPPVQAMSDFIERNFSREVELLKAFVRVPSDNPPGDCARHGEAAKPRAWASGRAPSGAGRVGQTWHGVGDQSGDPRRFGSGGAVMALNAHGDVVPPGQGWSHDPYGAEKGRRHLRPRRRGVEIGFRELWLCAAGAEGQSGRARRHGGAASDL